MKSTIVHEDVLFYDYAFMFHFDSTWILIMFDAPYFVHSNFFMLYFHWDFDNIFLDDYAGTNSFLYIFACHFL